MVNYVLEQDYNGHHLEEHKYYTHIKTGKIIQLFRSECGSFREVENNISINIFPHESQGKNYRPTTPEDFVNEINIALKRKSWLEEGLKALTQPPRKPQKQDFAQLRQAAMDGEP